MARKQYPETALLTAVAGVGVLIALTFILTLEDPHRFPKSGLWRLPGDEARRRQSGGRDPELGISKEGTCTCGSCWCRSACDSGRQWVAIATCGVSGKG